MVTRRITMPRGVRGGRLVRQPKKASLQRAGSLVARSPRGLAGSSAQLGTVNVLHHFAWHRSQTSGSLTAPDSVQHGSVQRQGCAVEDRDGGDCAGLLQTWGITVH